MTAAVLRHCSTGVATITIIIAYGAREDLGSAPPTVGRVIKTSLCPVPRRRRRCGADRKSTDSPRPPSVTERYMIVHLYCIDTPYAGARVIQYRNVRDTAFEAIVDVLLNVYFINACQKTPQHRTDRVEIVRDYIVDSTKLKSNRASFISNVFGILWIMVLAAAGRLLWFT